MSAIKKFVQWNRCICRQVSHIFPRAFSGDNYIEDLLLIIEAAIRTKQPKTILEAGGVDRPLLKKGNGFKFIGVDIEKRDGCDHLYDQFIVQSVEDAMPVAVDMIISITLMEHVPDNRRAAASIFQSLNPSGSTYHYIPSGLHPYSISLRLVGPAIQKFLIPILRPGAEAVTGYPAFFNYCTPKAMGNLFKDAGFTDVKVKPYYRANDYFAFFVPAYIFISLFENLCKAFGWRIFASGFIISAERSR
ncbi:MAG: methyltransferase domain-containing protein [Rhizobiales bacterium]|mgnify:FL=1|nr:methyltransferase domain-containing protein [Hyphomicrobiales bacterium]